MSTFCEKSDKSANLKLSGKPVGRVIKPKGKTKYVSQHLMSIWWKDKKPKLQKVMRNDRYIKKKLEQKWVREKL